MLVVLLCYCCGLKLGRVVHGGQDYIKYKNFENVLDKFFFKVLNLLNHLCFN